MDILLDKVSKRYRFEWIFKHITLHLQAGHRYAVTGPNGSGKSTLLKILSGHLTPSRGSIKFQETNHPISIDNVYQQVAYAAPYIDLIEEMTLKEAINFHLKFKPLQQDLTPDQLIEILGFQKSKNKEIRFFSSGMKQRFKLVLALCSKTDLLLLDEPTTNLDQQGVEWYRGLVDQYSKNRLVVIASNVDVDFDFCEEQISILDYK